MCGQRFRGTQARARARARDVKSFRGIRRKAGDAVRVGRSAGFLHLAGGPGVQCAASRAVHGRPKCEATCCGDWLPTGYGHTKCVETGGQHPLWQVELYLISFNILHRLLCYQKNWHQKPPLLDCKQASGQPSSTPPSPSRPLPSPAAASLQASNHLPRTAAPPPCPLSTAHRQAALRRPKSV